MGRAVTALGLDTADNVQLDYVCSSVGAVKLDLLTALYNACQGDSGLKEYKARTGKPRKTKGTTASDVDQDQIDLARVRVYFPSRDTVLRSQGGGNVSVYIGMLQDYHSLTRTLLLVGRHNPLHLQVVECGHIPAPSSP